MENVLFGDNQFFGVNHMSEEKARNQSMRFKKTEAVIDTLDIAYDMGINSFMCTTHDRISEVCDHMRANPSRYSNFKFYPGMPYAHKYANAVTEMGMFKALKKFLPGGLIGSTIRGGKALATQNAAEMMKMLIDAEMKMFKGLNTEVIFLQNVMTDLLLGMGFYNVFAEFSQYVKDKYDARAGFFTMNLPLLTDAIEKSEIETPVVCCSMNKLGFRMCGGEDAYKKALASNLFEPVAMSVLASGAISAEEAVKYVCNDLGVKSIVFGASTPAHIRQTKELIEQYANNQVQ